MPVLFFFKYAVLASAMTDIWEQPHSFTFTFTPARETNGNEPSRALARRGRWAAGSFSGPAATTSGATASEAEVRSPQGSCLWAGRGRLPRRGPGRDGGSGGRGWGRGGPGEAVPAGAAELLHLQPALRAARGWGTRSGAARRCQPTVGGGPEGGGGQAAGDGPGELGRVREGTPRSTCHSPPRAAFTRLCARSAPGPGNKWGARQRRQGLSRVRDRSQCIEWRLSRLIIPPHGLSLFAPILGD